MSDKTRLAAYNAVKRIFSGSYSNLVLPSGDLQGLDRAFAENIMLGTVERKVTLEYVLSHFVQKDPKPEVAALLLTGIYQILYMDRVPDSAACDETVDIAKLLFGQKTSGFVNAVMRSICRKKADVIAEIHDSDGHIKYSVDKALYRLLNTQYPQESDRIFEAFFGKAPMFIRVNTLKADAKSIVNKVGGKIIDETCIEVSNANNVMNMIDSGEFYVQGRASQEAVKLLGAEPGDTVIDVCACPGGKSLGAAIDMKDHGRIYSFDLHRNKLPLIDKSAERLGISIIETAVHDARSAIKELIGTADRVICDVPCSGTGVMGSKPEIKYKSPDDFKGLYPTQKAIIRAAAEYLKIGGVMVYSTCSINKRENEEVVSGFLTENKGYKLISEKTCLPFETEREGFYMAKLIREK